MRILGIDPGSFKCGWAVLDKMDNPPKTPGRNIAHHCSGVINLDRRRSRAERLVLLAETLSDIIAEHGPSIVASEEQFIYKNRNILYCAEARGACMVAIGKHKLPYIDINPTEAKMAAHGARADKKEVVQGVKRILGIADKMSYDQADACAIAIAGLLKKQRRR